MSREPPPETRLGSLEARILRDLWRHGESVVSEVHARLNAQGPRELAYNSVMSVMARLAEKEILHRRRDGRAYRYEAALAPDELASHIARREVRALLAEYGDAAIAGFVTEADRDERLRRKIRAALEAEKHEGQGDA